MEWTSNVPRWAWVFAPVVARALISPAQGNRRKVDCDSCFLYRISPSYECTGNIRADWYLLATEIASTRREHIDRSAVSSPTTTPKTKEHSIHTSILIVLPLITHQLTLFLTPLFLVGLQIGPFWQFRFGRVMRQSEGGSVCTRHFPNETTFSHKRNTSFSQIWQSSHTIMQTKDGNKKWYD